MNKPVFHSLSCPICRIEWESTQEADEDLIQYFPEKFATQRQAQLYLKLMYGWGTNNMWRMFTACIPQDKDGRIYSVQCTNCKTTQLLH